MAKEPASTNSERLLQPPGRLKRPPQVTSEGRCSYFNPGSELSKRLDGVWRYDQHIANAEGAPHVQDFWREIKDQDVKNVERLKELICEHVCKNDSEVRRSERRSY